MRRITIALCFLSAQSLYCNFFSRANYSAKATAMGHSVLVSDDIYAIYNNPAGIGLAETMEFILNYEMPFTSFADLDLINVNTGYLLPLPMLGTIPGAVAVNFSYFAEPDSITATKWTFSYSVLLKDILGEGTRVAAGANLNRYSYGIVENVYTRDNPLFADGTHMNALDLDVGAIYFISDVIQLAITYQSLLAPDITFSPDSDESLESVMKLGGVIHLPKLLFMETPLAAFSYNTRSLPDEIRKKPVEYHLGYSFTQFDKLLTLRLGYELGSDKYSVLGAGLGISYDIRRNRIGFDYAFSGSIAGGSGLATGPGNHQFTLLYKWVLPGYMLAETEQDKYELRMEHIKNQIWDRIQRESTREEKTETPPPDDTEDAGEAADKQSAGTDDEGAAQ